MSLNMLLAQVSPEGITVPMALFGMFVTGVFGAGSVYMLVTSNQKQHRIELNDHNAKLARHDERLNLAEKDSAVTQAKLQAVSVAIDGLDSKLEKIERLIMDLGPVRRSIPKE